MSVKRIYKYELPFEESGVVRVKIPWGFRPLDVQVQGGKFMLWAIVSTGDGRNAEREYTFHIYGTGWDVPDELSDSDMFKHLSTVQVDFFVWHIFMRDDGGKIL